MDPSEIRSDPDDQRERGLGADEQREERDRESQATDATKFELATDQEHEAREHLAERLADETLTSDNGEG